MKEVDGSPSKFAVDLRSMLAKVAREFQFSTVVLCRDVTRLYLVGHEHFVELLARA